MASRISTTTVVGADVQVSRALGLKHNLIDFTTLNQALNERTIIANLPEPLTRGMEVAPVYDYKTDSDLLSAKYLCIGNGGHKIITGGNNQIKRIDPAPNGAAGRMSIPYTLPIPHLATDTGLFNWIPYLGRLASEGLSVTERRQYGLRRTILINGELWEFYFARLLNVDRTTTVMNIVHVTDGESTSAEFVPTLNNLRPTHPTEDVTYNGSYATVSVPVEVVWNEKQIKDMRDACRILFGSEDLAIISEMAICTGLEKPVTQRYPASGPQVPVNVPPNTLFEIVACQVMMHITTYIPISFVEREYKLEMDIGATEPLYGVRGD